MHFALKKQAAKVAHLNLREEKHGEDPVLACDVKVSADVPNTFLDQISPTLRSSFYMAEGEGEASQPGLLADESHLPVLRHPFLGQQDFVGVEMPLVRVAFHGHKKADEVEITGEVNQLRGVLKEGGTVAIVFRVQFLPEDDQVGKLSALLGHAIKVSVFPVEAPASDTAES